MHSKLILIAFLQHIINTTYTINTRASTSVAITASIFLFSFAAFIAAKIVRFRINNPIKIIAVYVIHFTNHLNNTMNMMEQIKANKTETKMGFLKYKIYIVDYRSNFLDI